MDLRIRAASLALPVVVIATFMWAGVEAPASALPSADTGLVAGTVVSSYSGAPVPDVWVDLWSMDGGLAMETTTSVEGRYRFENVPLGSYLVSFYDEGGRYTEEFWDGAADPADADTVTVATSDPLRVDATLDPIKSIYPIFIGPSVVSPASGVWVGAPMTLEVACYGPGTETLPIGLVALQTSADGSSWTDVPIQLQPVWRTRWTLPGMRATVVPTSESRVYFRFVVREAEFVVPYASNSLLVMPRRDTSSWSATVLDESLWDLSVPARGFTVGMHATLTNASGAVDTTTPAFLQASQDGVTYSDVTAAAAAPIGFRSASGPVMGRTWFRFRSRGPSGLDRFSRPLLLQVKTLISIGSSTTSVRLPRPFILSGYLMQGQMGDPCIVEVQRPGSSRWSYSSARLSYRFNAFGGAEWWYRYTPKYRGTYRFRARYAGGRSGLPSLSGTVRVTVR